jgi:lysophospholipase L1-like esterase
MSSRRAASSGISQLSRLSALAALLGVLSPACASSTTQSGGAAGSSDGKSGAAGALAGSVNGGASAGAGTSSGAGTAGSNAAGAFGAGTGGQGAAGASAGAGTLSGGAAGVASGGASGAALGGASNAGSSSAGDGAGGTAHAGKWKIMPLGDSTTAATCVRARLWQRLSAANKTNVDFVGTEKSTGCSDSVPANFDQDNEGHSCYIVSNLVNVGAKPSCANLDYASNSTDLAKWFDGQMPDIVLMHFGTNDVWNGYAPEMILPAYKAVLDKLRMQNPRLKLFVAQIIPLKPDAGKNYDLIVRTLNAAIPKWASDNATSASPIVVVDQFTNYDVATDNQPDGVHPNPTGSDKIAKNWFDAIQALL